MNDDRFEQLTLFLSFCLLVIFLFLPLLMVGLFVHSERISINETVVTTSVGIVAVSRSMTRRILSASASNIARINLSFFSRTLGRAVLRKLLRITLRLVSRAFISSIKKDSEKQVSIRKSKNERRRSAFALALGSVVLGLSLFGVLYNDNSEVRFQIINSDSDDFDLVFLFIAALAPLAVYGIVNIVAARIMNIELRINTALDGVLLQIYFTISGSFFPVTTDFEYKGKNKERMIIALIAISTLYVFYLLLTVIYSWTDCDLVGFASYLFLLYCFVNIFPLKPLEGVYLWRENKLLWFLLWLLVVVSFFMSVPDYFLSII